jgi:hypothetical protein
LADFTPPGSGFAFGMRIQIQKEEMDTLGLGRKFSLSSFRESFRFRLFAKVFATFTFRFRESSLTQKRNFRESFHENKMFDFTKTKGENHSTPNFVYLYY